MITRLIEYGGVLFITLFCAVSIFFALVGRDLQESETIQKIVQFTSFFEDRFYDIRMKQTLGDEVQDRIVLAAIDDDSLHHIGRWPWSRVVWVEFMDRMHHFGARVVAFDIFFPEPETQILADGLTPDDHFADSIMRFQSTPGNHVILPYSLTNNPTQGFEEIPFELYMDMITAQSRGDHLRESWIHKTIFPVETLLMAEPMLGFIGTRADPDGVFRHYQLIANVEQSYFPSYSLKSYQAYSGDNTTVRISSPEDAYLLLDNGEEIALNFNGETKIRWLGGMSNFSFLSIHDLFSAELDDPEMHQLLNDTLVFVGSTAYAAHDLRHTPVDSTLPGVYYHMNMTHMLMTNHFLKPQVESTRLSWIILVVSTLMMVFIMMLRNPVLDMFSIVSIVLAALYIDVYYLTPQGYEIKLFFGLLSPLASYSWITFFNFYLTNKEKRAIRGTFSRYVSPAIVDQMLSDPSKVKIGGERKNITVFYSDIRDFTNISEQLTPEQLSLALNQYMGAMTNIVFKNKGTLDKYIGDMIVAYWGAPVEIENHAYWGLKAAVEMMEELPNVNQKLKEQGLPEFRHGMGLNTGECSVGNMGSDQIFSYTALGDNMNLGARVESLCKFYGVQINISEYTLDAIPDDLKKEFKYRPLDKVKVKGKERPVSLWEVLYPSHLLYHQDQALEQYTKAFELYLNKDFQQAYQIFESLQQKFPEDPSFKRMMETCQEFIKTPPPSDWDGVFTHKSKG